MDNKKEVKQFNKKLLIAFLAVLAIFATLLVTNIQAANVSTQIESLKQTDRPNPTSLTYEDLMGYYDILCCQQGTALPGKARVMLEGSYSGGSFMEDMGNWKDKGYGKGTKLFPHTIMYQGNDFDKSSYTHKTYGYYQIVEKHIATPKEAYIISEMKNELGLGGTTQSSAEMLVQDGQNQVYAGTPVNTIGQRLANGQMAYIVNQKYVLKTDSESYYVRAAKDRDGKLYYVYDINSDGTLKKYNGDFTHTDSQTGEKIACYGSYVNNVYYEYRGTISSGNTVAASEGTLYLVDYDTVVDVNGTYYYCYVTDSNSYIQVAWWTTDMGTSHGIVPPGVPNDLSKEAEAFENYILTITKKSSVSKLEYSEQAYDFYEADGTHVTGSVSAPVINYNPGFNEDADQNGTINEADQVTTSFNHETQTYLVGPFSLDYVKSSTKCGNRDLVDFASIQSVRLVSNLGELKYQNDWRFKHLDNQGIERPAEVYSYPKPNEVFYIEIDYKDNLTEINEFSFSFKYMNAGAELDIYDGTYNEVKWDVKYKDYESECTDPDCTSCPHFDHRDIWLECTSVTAYDSQTLAHALKGARFYNYKDCTKKFGMNGPDKKHGSVTVEKEIVGLEDKQDIVKIDRTFQFLMYVDGKPFQHLTVETKNGKGKATSNVVFWDANKPAPKYKIVELKFPGEDYETEGPWEGTIPEGNVVVKPINYKAPQKGYLEIDKLFFDYKSREFLENQEFEFTATVTGDFYYNNQKVESLLIDAKVSKDTDWKWISKEFKWYGDEPNYVIEEIIPEGATYELLEGKVHNGNNHLIANDTQRAVAINKSNLKYTFIHLDKEIINSTSPLSGEVFGANITIKGKFSYNGDALQERELEIPITLDEANNWKWNSEKIVWNEKDAVPEYTVKEVSMAEGTEFLSITNEEFSGTVNNFTAKLNPENTLITITNTRENPLVGRIQINKLGETRDLLGKTFEFKVNVEGKFKYYEQAEDGSVICTEYSEENKFEKIVSITLPSIEEVEENKDYEAKWVSGVFSWLKSNDTPKYTVEEINIPDDSEFISISNGNNTVTSSKSIDGELIAVEAEQQIVDYEKIDDIVAGKTVLTCINTGPTTIPKQAHLVIVKESEDESIDDYVFYFKVKITGTFKYWNIVNPDGTIGYTQYTNETLVLDGEIDDVDAVCGGEDWISELITWEENDENPTYTVEEISIPENIEFVSISNRDKTNKTPKIEGTLAEGTEYNYITAINKPGPNFEDGSIRIVKKTNRSLKGQVFYFDLEVKGTFEYNGIKYGPDEEAGDTYTLKDIQVKGNGNPWVGGKFIWDEKETAPTYKVTELNKTIQPDGTEGKPYKFVSISNEKDICTDASIRTVSGNLKLRKTVKLTAINYDDNMPNGSHIEITKEVLNNKLKGTPFCFDVEVTSKSPFKYHDLEDATKVTEYNAGDICKFEKVVAIADEVDWVSGYFEWDDGAEIPTYTVTELTDLMPDGVKTVSIRNDTEIICKELTNESGENLSISGSLTGDVTHIIAVNDSDTTDKLVHAKIVIEKKAINKIIEGEEFTFTLNLKGKFKYGGKDYTDLKIEDIKIKANGPDWTQEQIDNEKWVSEIIEWDEENDGTPTYTVTEETATLADGVKFVSITNGYETKSEPFISADVEGNPTVMEPKLNWIQAKNNYDRPDHHGWVQLKKVLLDSDGDEIKGIPFNFKLTVTFENGNTIEEILRVESGGPTVRSQKFTWLDGEKAPTYKLEELASDKYKCKIDKPTGSLIAQDTENGESGILDVNAIRATNNIKSHKAQIRVNKKLEIEDKISKDDVNENFKVLVTVTGEFMYKGESYNAEKPLVLEVTLSKETNWTWLSKEIKWLDDVEAPTFTVEEPKGKIPVAWEFVNVETPSNTLVSGEISVADVTNHWKPEEELLLTMKIGGKVWDDTNRKTDKYVDSLENGKIDEDEPGIENVKVTLYRALTERETGKIVNRFDDVYVFDENNLSVRIDNVTYTDKNGNWSFGAVAVPALTEDEAKIISPLNYIVTYDVEFEYDGQTYEPTEFLATAGNGPKSYVGADYTNNMYVDVANRWSTIINSSTSEKDNYLADSMAIDNKEERISFNNGFAGIQGKTVMDAQGNTEGTTDSGKTLKYTSEDVQSFFDSDITRKVSTLNTTKSNGEIYDDFKIDARTSNANLTFPFYNVDPNYDTTAWHLRGWDKVITGLTQEEIEKGYLGIRKTIYKFEAVYNYCLNINLGLVEREPANTAVEKDLTEALVVVNGKALKYKFNSAIDLEDSEYSSLLEKQLAVAERQIEYKLGLYNGDYYYRAEIYNADSEVKDALQDFYTKKLGVPDLTTTEMEIYLKYTINVWNQSETYDVEIGSVADYYDSTFKLITDSESKYVQSVNGKEVDNVIEVASPSTVTYYSSEGKEISNNQVVWTSLSSHTGSDGVQYNKIATSSLTGTKLATGEKASITVTFKIDKYSDNSVNNAIELGKKHNIAEVAKFTSYYSKDSENRWSAPGQISGRVDKNSAPDNLNIEQFNEKRYYEDDTDSAPIIKVTVGGKASRTISGIVWDDAQTESIGLGQVVGNGLYNTTEGDKLINGLTTEIYESITIPVAEDNGETVYKEYQFAWPTDKPLDDLGHRSLSQVTGFNQSITTKDGEYSFVGIPAGNYKVRFVYGDKVIETGKKDSEEIYNGQDYKSTAYQIGFNNDKDKDGYLDNEWHDLSDSKLASTRVNDARDSEARRLEISAKSEILTYENTSLLSTADNAKLFKDEETSNAEENRNNLLGSYNKNNPVTGTGYYMYAETAKINLNIEDINSIKPTDVSGVEIGEVSGTQDFEYKVKNIDCGIEERSQTKLTLDKQIKEITLITSDNNVILDAIYDIDYTTKLDGTIEASVTLNKQASTGLDHIASLNRKGHDQGYRYIIAEGTILQGTTIQVKYQLTVFNMSETDRISKDLENLWSVVNKSETTVEGKLRNADFQAAREKVSTPLYTESKGRVYNDGTGYTGVGYGTYFGSVYYLGKQGVGVRGDETIVKTEVHQMIDYIDPDVEFTDMNNMSRNQSWSNTDIEYLLNNNLIDKSIVQILDKDGNVTKDTAKDRGLNAGERYSIISDKYQEYMSDSKNNLVLTIDNGESSDTGSNPGFVKFLEPYMANKNIKDSTGAITLSVSRFYSSELDASDIDNLAEIIKVENTAGRRDSRNIAGNANPFKLDTSTGDPVGIFEVAQGKEKDASATEVITLSPPTGLNANESRTMQLIIVVTISITLVAVAIVIIKKKVLIKK